MVVPLKLGERRGMDTILAVSTDNRSRRHRHDDRPLRDSDGALMTGLFEPRRGKWFAVEY
jgi:hypothetical protein